MDFTAATHKKLLLSCCRHPNSSSHKIPQESSRLMLKGQKQQNKTLSATLLLILNEQNWENITLFLLEGTHWTLLGHFTFKYTLLPKKKKKPYPLDLYSQVNRSWGLNTEQRHYWHVWSSFFRLQFQPINTCWVLTRHHGFGLAPSKSSDRAHEKQEAPHYKLLTMPGIK